MQVQSIDGRLLYSLLLFNNSPRHRHSFAASQSVCKSTHLLSSQIPHISGRPIQDLSGDYLFSLHNQPFLALPKHHTLGIGFNLNMICLHYSALHIPSGWCLELSAEFQTDLTEAHLLSLLTYSFKLESSSWENQASS